jgi:urease accessory protein UreH
MARGERWSFRRYFSRNEIVREGRKIIIDAVELDSSQLALTNRFRVGRFDCFATVFIHGPLLRPFAENLLNQIAADPISTRTHLVWSASPVQQGAIVRLAGPSIEKVGQTLYRFLQFVPALLKDDPWTRKW